MNVAMSLVMQAALLGAGDNNTYASAYHNTRDTGRPLVVLVGADWCGACQTMKNSIMPQVQREGGLKDVNFAVVNLDREHDLADKLMVGGGGSVPQLVIYRKTATGWSLSRITGARSPSEIEAFINQPASSAAPATQTASRRNASTSDSTGS